jgi:hypothetical protein
MIQGQAGPPRGPIAKQTDKKRLTGPFTSAAQGTQKAEPIPEKDIPEPEKEGTLREAFARAALETTPEATPEPTPQTDTDTGLAEEFRRRAEKKERDGLDTGDSGREKRYRPAPVDHATRR